MVTSPGKTLRALKREPHLHTAFSKVFSKAKKVVKPAVYWPHHVLPNLDLHPLFQVNQANPAMAGKAVMVYEVPLGWPVSLGFLVLLALPALLGTASRRLAECRLDRELLVRTWKGHEWATQKSQSISINLHPAQTAEKKNKNKEWRRNTTLHPRFQ